MPERYIVAIEIGSSKLRGAIGLADDSGMLDVLAVEEEKLVGSVRYGCINNVEVSNAINCICERLEQYPRIAPRTIKGVYVSVGGRSTASTLIDVEARLGGEQDITREMIAAQNIPQERDVIDVAPVKFTVDNKTTVNPVGSYGTTVGARMCVLSCAPVIKRMIRRVIFEKVGLEINGYVARPLAEGALALTDEERRMGAMLVDLGAETTSVTIYKNGAPVYVATLPLGSRNITLDITHALNHIEERAEEIKKVSGNALGAESGRRTGADGIDYSEVNNYVHARAAEIITNILKQIEYAGMRTTDLPGGIVLIGGGSRLRGFNELLTQMSKMKVRMGTTQSAVRISDSAVNAADNIDVISTLVAAAQLPEAECMTEPEPEAEAETGSNEYDDSHDDDDDNVSRIGLEDDDDDDFATGKNKKPRKTSDSEEPSGKSRIFSWLRSRIATAMDEGDDM